MLASTILGPHGAGALAADDDCPCDAAAALDEAPGATTALAGEGDDHCPPGCDDCPCCGSPVAAVGTPRSGLGPVCLAASPVRRDRPIDAPRGERVGVFRPPRV